MGKSATAFRVCKKDEVDNGCLRFETLFAHTFRTQITSERELFKKPHSTANVGITMIAF